MGNVFLFFIILAFVLAAYLYYIKAFKQTPKSKLDSAPPINDSFQKPNP